MVEQTEAQKAGVEATLEEYRKMLNNSMSVRRLQQLAQEGVLVRGSKRGLINVPMSSFALIEHLNAYIKSGTARVNAARESKLITDREFVEVKIDERKKFLVSRKHLDALLGIYITSILRVIDRCESDLKRLRVTPRVRDTINNAFLRMRKQSADVRLPTNLEAIADYAEAEDDDSEDED